MKTGWSKFAAIALLGAGLSLWAADETVTLPESVDTLIASIQNADPQTRRELMNDLKTQLATLDAAQREAAISELQAAMEAAGVTVPAQAQLRNRVTVRATENASIAAQAGATAGTTAARNGAMAAQTAAAAGAQAGAMAVQQGTAAAQTAAQAGVMAAQSAAQAGAMASQAAVQAGTTAAQSALSTGVSAAQAVTARPDIPARTPVR
ncbi:MAG: hypothetical protein GXO33_01610 [Epsilonproteobacteria bacterium]|nr:hypothetical protein [Campylobacterota bacterium]